MGGKKIIQVNVSMSEEDFEMPMQTAKKLWPDADMSRSAIVLSLARLSVKTEVAERIIQ